jgi:hypothetical protein
MTKKDYIVKCSPFIGLGLVMTALCALSGCGERTEVGEVKGRVSHNGKSAQIEGSLITFLNSDNLAKKEFFPGGFDE